MQGSGENMADKQETEMDSSADGSRRRGASRERRGVTVAYVPKVLRSMAEICEAMGVGPKTVKAWVAKGAPIAVEGEGANTRYSAEMVRLQVWRVGGNCQYLFPP